MVVRRVASTARPRKSRSPSTKHKSKGSSGGDGDTTNPDDGGSTDGSTPRFAGFAHPHADRSLFSQTTSTSSGGHDGVQAEDDAPAVTPVSAPPPARQTITLAAPAPVFGQVQGRSGGPV